MTVFNKLVEEFSFDYLGDTDKENHSITLYDTPVKEYKEIYLRIRKHASRCRIVTVGIDGKVQNIKILDIDL